MGLDLWFRDDVTRILASAAESGRATTEALALSVPDGAATYQRGYTDALRVVSLAFGLSVPQNHQVRAGEWISARPVVEAGYRVGEVMPD